MAIYCQAVLVGALHPALQTRLEADVEVQHVPTQKMFKPQNRTDPERKNIRKSCSQFTGVFIKPVRAACTP